MLFLLVLLLVLGALFVGVVIGVIYRIKTTPWPYLKREYLLTQAEKSFYAVLVEAVGSDKLVFTKVRMADLLYLPKMESSSFYRHQNKIQSKHVDFVLCEKDTIKTVMAIELDDSTHLRADRIVRDVFVDKAFEAARLPILHIRAAASYRSEEIKNQVQTLLAAKAPAPVAETSTS
jgi:very-short-patch-repair endonuclease